MKRQAVLFTFLLSGMLAFSQTTKLPNTLLWRISGKGLTKPSYLYGTMHLMDKKLFQLGDSVYKALEQTEGFAAELDMNKMGTQLINQMMSQGQEDLEKETVFVKDIVSPKIWTLYKDQLAKKFNKKADKVTVADLEKVKKDLEAEMYTKGEMPTFLDAWLFGHARRQGKWVGGIEDLEDQLEHIKKDSEIEDKIFLALYEDKFFRDYLTAFIRIYTNQQLDSIDAFMNRETKGKDFIMIKRNLKMARRMDSLSAVRSTLFAVGAAHLPGDSGVIALLRSEGFTVTPVFSSKKINSDNYVSVAAASQWMPVAISDSSYSLQMPGASDGVEMFESMGMEMKMFFDISFMKMYMTFNIDMPEERRTLSADSLYSGIKSRYETKGQTAIEKKIVVSGIEGREYFISTAEGDLTLQVFLPFKEKAVLNGVFTLRKKVPADQETENFFQSFVYNRSQARAIIKPAATAWTRMDFPLHSYSIEMPLKRPKETRDESTEEGKIIYTWQAVDTKDQVFYGMRVIAMKEGMYDTGDDTTYFIAIKDALRSGFEDASILDSSFITINNFPAYSVTATGKSEGDYYVTKIVAVNRGGLGYYLFAVYPPSDKNSASAKRFLNSFQLVPYKHPEWETVSSPDKTFTTSSPFPFAASETIDGDIHPGAKRYITFDSIGAVTLYIDRTIIPNWYWYESDTAFLRQRTAQYVAYGDSIAGYEVGDNGTNKTASFTVIKQGDHLIKKVKLIFNGNELIEIFGNFAQQDMAGLYNRYFEDFRILNLQPVVSRSQSRVNELSAALKKADTTDIKIIKHWWDGLKFSKEDVPALQKMALKVYPDFDSTFYGNINVSIFDKIEFLDSSYTTVDFIRNNYSAIQPADEYIKPLLISYLSGIKTKESYGLIKESLLKHSFNVKEQNYYSYSFYDSLQLTATLFPEILSLGGKEALWDLVVSSTVLLLDSNLLDKNVIKANGKYFIESAKRVLAKGKEEIEEDGYAYNDLIRLLGIINTPESNSLLVKFSKFSNRQIRFVTLIAMLENNQPVDVKTINTLSSTDEYRHLLYDELLRLNKLKFFPPAYLSQKELGKSKLYTFSTEDDEEQPQLLESVGERIEMYKGKQQKFYLYKISFDDMVSTIHLGVAGPYSLNAKDMKSSHEVTGVYWDKDFDTKKLDSLLKDYLKQLEDYEKESEEDE